MSSSPNPSNEASQAILKTDEPDWDEKMGEIPPGMDVAGAFAPGGRLAALRENLRSYEKKTAKAEKALKTARRKFNKALDKTAEARDKKRAAEEEFYRELEVEKACYPNKEQHDRVA
jgi:hypothetical protein